ncbi:MAG: hypothetical protein Q9214_001558 [Letrouitia sp. 1 TL-2023]
MNSQHHPNHDVYYDQPASRSPGAHRHQQQPLHRQPSRQFDVYGPMANNVFTPDDHTLRYDGSRFDRINATLQGGGYGFEMAGAQTWNPNAFSGGNGFSAFGPTGRMKSVPRGRSTLPPTWLDQQQLHTTNGYGAVGPSPLGMSQLRPEQYGGDPDEELIPTAIVIKNIPFAVKKEQLTELMSSMGLPLPYAFNYHFDNGVFRGLAFANFTSAEETAAVIDGLNHFELQGRKLRVEYKKMLPLQERERIEREKRERRGQLEEQHRPMGTTQLHSQPSMSSISSHIPATTPSPISSRNEKPGMRMLRQLFKGSADTSRQDVDLNDPQTLGFYSQLLLFKDDMNREALIFPPRIPPQSRRIIHTLAHHMGLSHLSRGTGEERQVHVFRQAINISPPIPQGSTIHGDPNRRALNRAATIDFNEARSSETGMYGTLRGQQSSGFLGIPDSPGGFGAQNSLRAAKSFADLRSYTPSPAPSTASFPAALQSNIARFQNQENYGSVSAVSATPTLTPTASGSALGQHRDESMLVNGFSGMSLGGGNLGPTSGSPRRLRGMFSFNQDNQPITTEPIGSNRTFSMGNYDDQSRDRSGNVPMRQPRGPAGERTGFSRGRQNGHQGRGSDELKPSPSVEIIVE